MTFSGDLKILSELAKVKIHEFKLDRVDCISFFQQKHHLSITKSSRQFTQEHSTFCEVKL